MPNDKQPSRRTILQSISTLGAMGIAPTEITDVRAGSRAEYVKRIKGHLEPDTPDWVYVPFEVTDDTAELTTLSRFYLIRLQKERMPFEVPLLRRLLLHYQYDRFLRERSTYGSFS